MNAWDRQEGEPAMWYARFLVYLSGGTERSVAKAQAVATRKPVKNSKPAGSWAVASKKWKWQARASAFDTDNAQRMVKTHKDHLEEAQLVTARALSRSMRLIDDALATRETGDREALVKMGPWLVTLVGGGQGVEKVLGSMRALNGDKVKVTKEETLVLTFKDDAGDE